MLVNYENFCKSTAIKSILIKALDAFLICA
nr:MAG TPA: hypothetical protein [Bacteriophage sp.]